MSTITIGVDLAKSTFSTCEVDGTGRVQRRQELKSDAFARSLAVLPAGSTLAFDASSGARHWAGEGFRISIEASSAVAIA